MTLYKGLKDITTSERVSKEVSDDYIRFTIHNATIPDSGTYFVVARNEFGTDRLFVTINVSNCVLCLIFLNCEAFEDFLGTLFF